ncbi:MAG: AAA family ATPase [Candidatus Poribacteria bacterium]|nr:AAA family ATPase [Candidatus Poribacteria bacterium]
MNRIEVPLKVTIRDNPHRDTVAKQPFSAEINVANFGPIKASCVDLRPLTVFVGPSNTGKTYLATLVYALHGAFNSLTHPSLLSPLGSGKVMDLLKLMMNSTTAATAEIQEMLNRLGKHEQPFKLSDMPVEMREHLFSLLKEDTGLFKGVLQQLQDELKNCFDLGSIAELNRLTDEQSNQFNIGLKIGSKTDKYWDIRMTHAESAAIDMDVSHFFDDPMPDSLVLLPSGWSVYGRLDDNTVTMGSIGYTIRDRYYLPASRSGIMQSHRIIASSLITRATRVGLERLPEMPTLSGAVADFMQKIIQYTEKGNGNPEMQKIAESLESNVLGGQVRLEPSLSGYPDFRYAPNGAATELHLSQSSAMVSELASLVLFLRSGVKPGDMLIIEEPEAHLHPGAQADMAVILASLVRAGVSVIATTHSDWLLEEIGNLILEGLLAEQTDASASWLLPEEVGAWHFQRDEPVKEIPFKPREGISPKDYEDVAEGLYNRSVNLQQRFEKKKGKRA